MPSTPLLYQWTNEIAMHLPCLNSWQKTNLALFSLGVIESEKSQQMAIARKVVCGEKTASAEKRLRRFIANDKVPLEGFFEEWTQWVLDSSSDQAITLLVDETKLEDRQGAMMVGLAYEGRCIPLAWRCYEANDKQGYPAEGQVGVIMNLLQTIQPAIPAQRKVIVLADRGIGTSPQLCRQIEQMGWYYLFRVTKMSKIVSDLAEYTIYEQVQEGETWAASGLIFKQRGRIPAHARAIWQDGYDQPWALVTNDPALTGWEYAKRNWQEQSFRDLKSGGWQWSSSRIRSPQHMARFLMILVVAYAWVLGLGSYAVHWRQARSLTKRANGTLRRQWSLFKEGLQLFTDYVLKQNVCLKPCFVLDKRLC